MYRMISALYEHKYTCYKQVLALYENVWKLCCGDGDDDDDDLSAAVLTPVLREDVHHMQTVQLVLLLLLKHVLAVLRPAE